MKDNLENLIQKAKSAALRPEEKSRLRFTLQKLANDTKVATPFWSFTFIQTYHYIPATLVVLFILGGGTSFLAQGALPGDALYSMKLNVNESLESTFTWNDMQSAEVEALQATRRLEEAETLASVGLLTVEQNDEIKTSFSKKVNSLNQKLGKMSDEGDEDKAQEVLNKFDTNVQTKISKLAEVSEKKNTKEAIDIVTFINDNHEENTSRKLAPTTMMMSVAEDAKPPEASGTSLVSSQMNSSTTTGVAKDSSSKKTKKMNIRVMWSWKDKR